MKERGPQRLRSETDRECVRSVPAVRADAQRQEAAQKKNKVPVLPFDEIEVDKIPGAWVVTHWLSDDVTLRLKVAYVNGVDPAEIVAEVRNGSAEEFEVIHRAMIATYSLTHLDEWPEEWEAMPEVYTGQFMAMAQLFAELTFIVEFGPSVRDGTRDQPRSSRDHIR